ncbi:hypothetical protein DCAR_0312515 [Daucus carota subsp. sativus]|uniref:Uncharacterized protein n=1 Tax=Daucus carota subsp. sativus TaxID=79200 RepID=A0A166B2K6_DAUCS|nr:hypothetical protein DCAR_0312515 [Daucus carota subsp. sativus]
MTMISVQPYTLTSWQLEMENINHSANDNINLSVEELEASVTFECLYNIIRQLEGCSPPSPNDRRTMESNKTERKRTDLSSFNAHNTSITKEATANFTMKAHAKIVLRAEMLPNVNNNTEEEKKSGSQDLTVSSAPNIPVKPTVSADILSMKEFLPAPDIKDITVKEIESCFLDLPIPSTPNAPVQNSSNTRAAAAALEMEALAPAIIVLRAKVLEEPWMLTGWLPQNDNIQPSAEELQADVKFEHLYNIIRHHDESPPPSPNNQRLPVFKDIYN